MRNYIVLFQNLEKRNKLLFVLKIIPVVLVILHLICFVLTSFNFYNERFFNILLELIDTSLITCGVFMILSKLFKWNKFINKNINILISFNLFNLFINPITNNNYHTIYMYIIIIYFIYLILYSKIQNGREMENN